MTSPSACRRGGTGAAPAQAGRGAHRAGRFRYRPFLVVAPRDYLIDCLKIDRFISRMEDEPATQAIIRAVATLGPSLDLVAAGVEDIGQRELLFECGCRLGQRFLYAPALPACAVAGYLQAHPRR